MIESPMPTRAEATDVANAVYEEVDAVMLSGETTVGKYPLKAIEALDRIARVSEQARGLQFVNVLIKDKDKQFLAASAVEMAESLSASGIVVITRRGFMANYLANCLPTQVQIFAFTNDSRTRRQLSLSRGVIPYRTTFSQDPEKTLVSAFNVLKKKEGLSTGDKVVVISDVIAGQGIDAIQIRALP
jgi:pyruvate kinase